MVKNFNQWHKYKKYLHYSKRVIYFQEKEIWWCSLGVNIGYEQDGKNINFERPVLIVRKFNNDLLWILPITSRSKTGRYYFQFAYKGKGYSVILSQIRLISVKRLLRKIRTMQSDDFDKIRKRLNRLI